MKSMTYLEILGLDEDDFKGKTEAEIQKELKTAQREMRKACHPDRAAARGETEEETQINKELFTKVDEAYDFLKDPAKRNPYIKQLNQAQDQDQAKPESQTQRQGQSQRKPRPQKQRQKQQRPRHKHRAKTNYAAQPGAVLKAAASVAVNAFKAVNAPIAYTSKKAEQAHKALQEKSKTSKAAMGARIALGLVNMTLTHSIPAAVTLSLLLGVVKIAQETSLEDIALQNLNTANPICTGEYSRNMSQENFNTLVMLYASTENPNFRQMLLSNADAHIRTGFSFEYALVQAYLESSWGANVSADTSTARGNHQFIEQSWLERFKKDAAKFSPTLASYADQIYWANDAEGKPLPSNGWRVHGGLEQAILDMRLENPELEAFLSLQWRAELHPNLVEHIAPENRDKLDILLEHTNFDVLVSAVRHLKENIALRLHNPMAMIDEQALEQAKEMQKIQAFNLAYTSQFLGPNGAIRFAQGVDQTPLRTASLDFAQQASANEGIFGERGERSYNEVNFVIDEKIEGALQAIAEKREEGAQRGGYQSVCDVTFELDAINVLLQAQQALPPLESVPRPRPRPEESVPRPQPRPADLGKGT